MGEGNILVQGRPFSHIGTEDIGILFIHGFTGMTGSMRDIATHFAEKGYHVELPRLSGHGTDNWLNLKNITYKDWIKDVEDALFSLEKRTSSLFITGLSMGGTLSLYLSEVYPEKIKGVIPINPAIFVHDKLIRFVPVLKYIITSLPGIGSDIQKEDIIEPAYKRFPMASGYELYKLMNIVRENLKDVVSPLLMMASQADHLVPVEDKKYIYGHISSQIKDILILENSYHVATMDNDQSKIVEGIEKWIEKNK